MSCGQRAQSEAWMMDALDGALPAPDHGRLVAHLETCVDCRTEWEALNALEGMLTDPPLLYPPPGFPGRVEARIARFEAQRRTLIGGLILLGAAAALCLLAVPSLLDGQGPVEAYAAFLHTAYGLLGHGLQLGYRLLSALWLTVNVLAASVDVALANVLVYVVGTLLAVAAWRRAGRSGVEIDGS